MAMVKFNGKGYKLTTSLGSAVGVAKGFNSSNPSEELWEFDFTSPDGIETNFCLGVEAIHAMLSIIEKLVKESTHD